MTYYEAHEKGRCIKCDRYSPICREDNFCYDDCRKGTTILRIHMIGDAVLDFFFNTKEERTHVLTSMLTNCKQWTKIGDTVINRNNINYIEIKEEKNA
jgi:hypothetical protein